MSRLANSAIYSLLRSALVAQAVGEYEVAFAHLTNALRVAEEAGDHSHVAMVASDLGALCDHLGRREEATEYWQHAVSAVPDDPWGYLALALAYERLGASHLATSARRACREVAERTGDKEVLSILSRNAKQQ